MQDAIDITEYVRRFKFSAESGISFHNGEIDGAIKENKIVVFCEAEVPIKSDRKYFISAKQKRKHWFDWDVTFEIIFGNPQFNKFSSVVIMLASVDSINIIDKTNYGFVAKTLRRVFKYG